jgi:hypothetical protein
MLMRARTWLLALIIAVLLVLAIALPALAVHYDTY